AGLCRRRTLLAPGSVLSRAHIYGYGRSLRPPQGTTSVRRRRAPFRRTLLDLRDRLDLDPGARGERRDLHSCARGRRGPHVTRVDLVHRAEVVEVDQEDGRLDQAVEAASGLFQNGSQVLEDLLGLLDDAAFNAFVAGLQP